MQDSQEIVDAFLDEQDEADFEEWARLQDSFGIDLNPEEEVPALSNQAAFDAFLYLTAQAWQINIRTATGRVVTIKIKQTQFAGTSVQEIKVRR